MTLDLLIRPCERTDAPGIAALAGELQTHLRSLGDQTDFTWGAEHYLRDGFGETPAFEGFVAEVDNRIVGYLLYHFGYDSDHGQRLVFVVDLYVAAVARRRGIGSRLMRRATEIGKAHGAEAMVWSVYKQNRGALRFYEKLGARYIEELHFMALPI